MAESAIFFTTNGTGDGSAAGYNQAALLAFYNRTLLSDNTTEGVLVNYANTLAVSGAASPLTVATGAAVVAGFNYENTTPLSLTVATPAGALTGGRVILRADFTLQTVRATTILSASGVSTFPAITQTANTTWEIPLANFTITNAGVITLTDVRAYAHFNTRVKTSMIDPLAIDSTKIANLTITAAQIANGTITAAQIAALTITAAQIVANTITAAQIANGTVTAAQIAALTITTGLIANNAIDNTKIGTAVPTLLNRRGVDSNEWGGSGYGGTTNYTISGNVKMQAGSAEFTTNNQVTITFPVAFSYRPIVLVTPVANFGTTNINAPVINLITASNFQLYNPYAGTMNYSWLAIGPA